MSKEVLSFAAAGRMLDSGRSDPFLRELREAEENQLHITICDAPWKHYRISTQNQIIDVIAQTEPKVYR